MQVADGCIHAWHYPRESRWTTSRRVRLVGTGARFKKLRYFERVGCAKTPRRSRGAGHIPAGPGSLGPALMITPAVGTRSRFRCGSGEPARLVAGRRLVAAPGGRPTPPSPHGSAPRPPGSP